MKDAIRFELPAGADLIGWLLLHSLWQGALIGIGAALLMKHLRGADARARYALACAGMSAMALAPLATWWLLPLPGPADGSFLGTSVPVVEAQKETGGQNMMLQLSAAAWLLGALLFQSRIALLLLRSHRLRNRDVALPPRAVRDAVRELGAAMRLRTGVRVLVSKHVDVPAVLGWLSPIVLLPPCALSGLSPAELRAVLAHELAHLRRLDPLVNLLQAIFEALFFFHPAAWWLSSRARVEREFCCDDLAVTACEDSLALARGLTRLETLRDAHAALALSSTGGPLMQRIRRLVAPERATSRAGGATLFTLMLALAGVSALGASAWARSPAQGRRLPTAPRMERSLAGQSERPRQLEARISRLRAELDELEARLELLRSLRSSAPEDLRTERRNPLAEPQQRRRVRGIERTDAPRRRLPSAIEPAPEPPRRGRRPAPPSLRRVPAPLAEPPAERAQPREPREPRQSRMRLPSPPRAPSPRVRAETPDLQSLPRMRMPEASPPAPQVTPEPRRLRARPFLASPPGARGFRFRGFGPSGAPPDSPPEAAPEDLQPRIHLRLRAPRAEASPSPRSEPAPETAPEPSPQRRRAQAR